MTSDIKRILYASDLNDGSRPAFRKAVNIAEKFDAKITYLHVMGVIPESSTGVIEGYLGEGKLEEHQKTNMHELTIEARARVQAFCDSESDDDFKNLDISIVIKSGNAWRSILETAESLDADIIVLGARKHNAVEKLFLGSTSNKVAQNTTRPILIVPLTDND